MIIGIDFDNTIAGYDELFSRLAADIDLVEHGVIATKENIRDLVRGTPDGETTWRQLQGVAYGERMHEATLIDGVSDFFRAAHKQKILFYIISHKTRWAAEGKTGVDLRKAAMDWMRAHRFFDDDEGFGLSPSSVFFEASREAKIARIASLKCTHFIDDLVETFAEPSFPEKIEKILFGGKAIDGVRRYSNWNEIRNDIVEGAR